MSRARGAGAARFRVAYLEPDAAGGGAVEIDLEAENLTDLRQTMAGQGWTIEEPDEPLPGGMRLLVHASPGDWSWHREGCPLSIAASGGHLTVTLAVPGLDTSPVNWSPRGLQLNNLFEQLILGPYDDRGRRSTRTPRM